MTTLRTAAALGKAVFAEWRKADRDEKITIVVALTLCAIGLVIDTIDPRDRRS